jgi:hypothetical protein
MNGMFQQERLPNIGECESQDASAVRHSSLIKFLTNRKEGTNHGNGSQVPGDARDYERWNEVE